MQCKRVARRNYSSRWSHGGSGRRSERAVGLDAHLSTCYLDSGRGGVEWHPQPQAHFRHRLDTAKWLGPLYIGIMALNFASILMERSATAVSGAVSSAYSAASRCQPSSAPQHCGRCHWPRRLAAKNNLSLCCSCRGQLAIAFFTHVTPAEVWRGWAARASLRKGTVGCWQSHWTLHRGSPRALPHQSCS